MVHTAKSQKPTFSKAHIKRCECLLTCSPFDALMKKPFFYILFLFSLRALAQPAPLPEKQWVDSVFHSLSKDERIGQLIIIRAHSNLSPEHVEAVKELIMK